MRIYIEALVDADSFMSGAILHNAIGQAIEKAFFLVPKIIKLDIKVDDDIPAERIQTSPNL